MITLPDALMDLEKIRDVMEGVAAFFGGADGLLTDYAVAPYSVGAWTR